MGWFWFEFKRWGIRCWCCMRNGELVGTGVLLTTPKEGEDGIDDDCHWCNFKACVNSVRMASAAAAAAHFHIYTHFAVSSVLLLLC